MAHGLESRVPFARPPDSSSSRRRIPADVKFKDGDLKHVLQARPFAPIVPRARSPTRKDKMGFPVPLTEWVAEAARPRVRRATCCPRDAARDRELIDNRKVLAGLDGEQRVRPQDSGGCSRLELWQQRSSTTASTSSGSCCTRRRQCSHEGAHHRRRRLHRLPPRRSAARARRRGRSSSTTSRPAAATTCAEHDAADARRGHDRRRRRSSSRRSSRLRARRRRPRRRVVQGSGRLGRGRAHERARARRTSSRRPRRPACGGSIYFQTALCYGLQPLEQPITLDHPLRPDGSSYAISKTAGEHYVASQRARLDLVPARQRLRAAQPQRPAADVLPAADRRTSACFVMDTRRDFIFVDDLVDVVVQGDRRRRAERRLPRLLGLRLLDQGAVRRDDRRAGHRARRADVEVRPRGADDALTILLDPSRDRGRLRLADVTTPLEDGVAQRDRLLPRARHRRDVHAPEARRRASRRGRLGERRQRPRRRRRGLRRLQPRPRAARATAPTRVVVVDNLLSAERENLPDDARVELRRGLDRRRRRARRRSTTTSTTSSTSRPTTATRARSPTRSPTTRTT